MKNLLLAIRWHLRALIGKVVRGLGLRPLAVRLRDRLHKWASRFAPPEEPPPFEADPPGRYDVICLPVISWRSRFQRPQQLMRQFVLRGHRVFYASPIFHDSKNAKLTPIEEAELNGGDSDCSGALPPIMKVWLPGRPGLSVYRDLPTADDVERMAAAIDCVRRNERIAAAVIVVQLPFWTALAETLRERFGWPIVYDCMDDHSGFSTNGDEMLRAEDHTVATADLVVVTSEVLREKVGPKARRTALIRNACDYEHFAAVSRFAKECGEGKNALQASLDSAGLGSSNGPHPSPAAGEGTHKCTIGFYGAIAEWFDADLVADLAELRPNWRFDLIGDTHTGDVTRLATLPNVALRGEKPYADLPEAMASWDCCIIPFKRIPLTEATNPVKAYEMLAAGKPVVAVELPELRPLSEEGLLSVADDAAGFAAAIETAIAEECRTEQARRKEFAKTNTWQHRCDALDKAIRELFPLASIIVVTYNNLAINQACLESIYRKTDWPNYEVIVVDNASKDGTPEWLEKQAADRQRLKVILNDDNRGFSGANNQGMEVAKGDYLCLLNNDTLVTHGWLSTLIDHLRKMPEVGIVGPVSNRVGNEAKVPVGYTTPAEMPRWAATYCWRHDGETFSISMLGFFCVVFSRDLYRRVGELDERFGVGCFEDDDYCRRVRELGYDLCCARDAFVHHWLEASFQLMERQQYLDIFYENKRRYEAKWTGNEAVTTNR